MKHIYYILFVFGWLFSQIFTQDFAIVRLKYKGGGDWYCDPTSLPNLIKAIQSRTNIAVQDAEVRIEIMDEKLFSFPFIYLSGHGNIKFADQEVKRLRKYLLNGGFLYADDNYGMDKFFRREMKKVFPEKKFVELPYSHPIYHSFYRFPSGLPKIHEHHGGSPKGLALFQEKRMIVFYSYNTDIGDGWEDITVHNDPESKHRAALKMGINIITYVLTH